MRVWAKTDGEVREGKFLVVRRDASVPLWPHFVIGARDPAAPAALMAYADRCQELGMDADFVASIRELAMDFEAYRVAEGHGDPNAGPHRKDDPEVVKAMRREPATIRPWFEDRNEQKG